MKIGSRLVCATAALVAALVAAPPASADRVIARGGFAFEDGEPSIAAYRGALAWVREGEEDDEGAITDYRLVIRSGGRNRDARVAPFGSPVPVDLGPGRGGGAVAVYPRCDASGCDLYELAVRSGRERRLGGISGRASERAGATWRGRYLFSRLGQGLFLDRPRRRLARQAPLELDLRGRWAAFATGVGPPRNTEAGGERDSAIVVKRVGRRGCVVARARPPELGDDDFPVLRNGRGWVHSPVLDGRHVYWVSEVIRHRRTYIRIHRRRRPGPRCGRTRSRSILFRSTAAIDYSWEIPIAVDRGKVFVADGNAIVQLTGGRRRFR